MLEPSVKQKILDQHEKMNSEGKLLSRQKLEQCYSLFRGRFGPDQLKSMGGETLLSSMHDHGNRESLVYWLEFKNDDEFPASFGSIAGGSALKFGVFRRADSGEWATYGDGHKPKDIPVEQVIEIARKHRDQLVKGAEVLKAFQANAGDAEYLELQQQLDQAAPDVSNLGWGHKYFSLLFPDTLDDYHSPDLQRFHLLKMLQLPPEKDGRYVCAGRFVDAGRDTNLILNHLSTVLNQLQTWHRYWRIGTSDGTAPRNRWDMMRSGNLVAIGWPDIGDLSTLEATKEGRETLVALLQAKYPTAPQTTGRSRVQISNFVTSITKGDLVLAADGNTVIGIGRVTGEYVYDSSSPFPHHRPVEWLSFDEWKTPTPEGLQTTVYEIRKHPNILEAERKIQNKGPIEGGTRVVRQGSAPSLAGIPGRIQAVLERKSQVILYGPPGTGNQRLRSYVFDVPE